MLISNGDCGADLPNLNTASLVSDLRTLASHLTAIRSSFLLSKARIRVTSMRQGTQGWCTGMTPRGMGWGEKWEGSSGWGTQCTSTGDSCQCMAKTTTIS